MYNDDLIGKKTDNLLLFKKTLSVQILVKLKPKVVFNDIENA